MNEIWTWLINNSGVMMVILTGITIIISIILQIRLEKQRNEDIRARVHGTLVSDDLHTYLCLSNIGKQCAWNVRISLNGDFIDVLPNHMKNKEYLKILNDEPIIIEPGDKLYYLLDRVFSKMFQLYVLFIVVIFYISVKYPKLNR